MTTKNIDPITLEVMRNAFYSISEEMNAALIRASYSTNIKDRRDASCAIYTATGDIVVVAAGREFEHVATNSMGELLMATPAFSEGMMYVRSVDTLFAIGR